MQNYKLGALHTFKSKAKINMIQNAIQLNVDLPSYVINVTIIRISSTKNKLLLF